MMVALFYLAGLGLAFTPCVLPMVPILSGIIAGGGQQQTTGRAFMLSLTYVLGMAITYTAAGVAGAAMVARSRACSSSGGCCALFAALFVAMALSMFGLFTVQMPGGDPDPHRCPSATASRPAPSAASRSWVRSRRSSSPPAWVRRSSAPLLVISQTGQIARGGAALFAMSMGMGEYRRRSSAASAGKLLPKAGPVDGSGQEALRGHDAGGRPPGCWRASCPSASRCLLWAVPAFILAWLLWSTMRKRSPVALGPARHRLVGVALYGAALAAGAALGRHRPAGADTGLCRQDPRAAVPAHPARLAELDLRPWRRRSLAGASSVLVDFSADWCTSCKEMERYTFTDLAVQQALRSTVLLRANVTQNNADDQALLKRFGIFGPPTIAFYGTDGQERARFRVVGYMKAGAFAERTRAAFNATS